MIQINNLSFRYPGKNEDVLKDISFSVSAGEIIVFLGGSGAGKSTLLKCIGRLIEPREGEIYINKKDFLNLKGKEAIRVSRRIGYIFQQFNLIERNTVLNNVLDGRLACASILQSAFHCHNNKNVKIAKDSLERVDMISYANQRVENLSGGQKQRVAIARALTQDTKIILADEPIASLDPKLMREIMNLLRKVCLERNITLLLSLHFLDIAKEYATRIIGINKGRIVFNDKTEELTEKDIVNIYGETEEWRLFGKIGY